MNQKPRSRRERPAAALDLAAGIRHLDSLGMAALTDAFREWAYRSARRDVTVSRVRVLFIYLIIRHTGARLGEALGINDLTDFDFDGPTAKIGGREIQLPQALADELRQTLAEKEYAPFRGTFFNMDPGHIRRKFYERAKEAKLDQDLASPNAIRRSRAIELLREDVPLTVVQKLLGQSTADLTAAFMDISDEDARRIERRVLERESRKTSARNAFYGRVSAVRKGDIQAVVEVATLGGTTITAIITNASLSGLGLKKGVYAAAEIKAPWVMLAKPEADGGPPRISAENILAGEITAVNMGKIIAEITMAVPGGLSVCALLGAAKAAELGFSPGDPAYASFSASTVILNVD